MLLEALISTTYKRHQKALTLAEDIFLHSGVRSVIICQLFDMDSCCLTPVDIECERYSIYFVNSVGLAVSRNAAVEKSRASFGWLLDDDVTICKVGIKLLLEKLANSEDVSAVTCKFTDDKGNTRKLYNQKEYRHDKFSIMKVSSIEIVLNLQFVKNAKVSFDTRFGLGAIYPSGEENIILSDILAANGVVYYFPIVLCFHPLETSCTVAYSSAQWEAKGALIKRSFGMFGLVLLIPFLLKRLFNKEESFKSLINSFHRMLKGFANVRKRF